MAPDRFPSGLLSCPSFFFLLSHVLTASVAFRSRLLRFQSLSEAEAVIQHIWYTFVLTFYTTSQPPELGSFW